jgi:hypothetical protein
MAKGWFESEFGKSKTITPPNSPTHTPTTSFTGDSTLGDYYFEYSFQITPTWSEAEISSYLSVYPIVIVPIQPIAFLDANDQHYALVIYREANSQLAAKLQVYNALPDYQLTHSVYDVSNFSGLMYQICMDGKVERVFGIDNGVCIANFTLLPNENMGRIQASSRSICSQCNSTRPLGFDAFICALCRAFKTGKKDDDRGSGRSAETGLGFSFSFGPGVSPTGSTNGSGGGGGSSTGNGANLNGQINNSLFSLTQLNQIRTLFYANDLEDLFELLKSTDQQQLSLVNSFVKRNNATAIAALKKFTDDGFSFNEFKALYDNQILFSKAEIFLNIHSSRGDFIQRIRQVMNPNGYSFSITEKIARFEAFIDITNDFKTELTQLAQQDRTFITSGGDMNILMRIFGKVLGKKIGKVIPFVGTALGADAAWTAYSLGNYWEAAFELAGVAMDFIPAGIVVETGWTVLGAAYDAFKVYKPIIALGDFLATNRVLLDALIETLDDLNLFSNIELINTSKSAVSQFKITLGSRSVEEFLTTLASRLGNVWQDFSWGKSLEISPNFKLSFYPISTSNSGPTIQIELNGVFFKIRLQ